MGNYPTTLAEKMFGDVAVSNGIAWSLDNKIMYFIDR